jgi:hypothetical protein
MQWGEVRVLAIKARDGGDKVGWSERASARSSQSDRRQAPAEAAQLVKHTQHSQSERARERLAAG